MYFWKLKYNVKNRRTYVLNIKKKNMEYTYPLNKENILMIKGLVIF